MKEPIKYSGLWQKKREELKTENNPATDWLEMQTLLDKHMPGPAQPAPGSFLKYFKAGSILGVTLAGAIIVYFYPNFRSKPSQKQRVGVHQTKRDTVDLAASIKLPSNTALTTTKAAALYTDSVNGHTPAGATTLAAAPSPVVAAGDLSIGRKAKVAGKTNSTGNANPLKTLGGHPQQKQRMGGKAIIIIVDNLSTTAKVAGKRSVTSLTAVSGNASFLPPGSNFTAANNIRGRDTTKVYDQKLDRSPAIIADSIAKAHHQTGQPAIVFDTLTNSNQHGQGVSGAAKAQKSQNGPLAKAFKTQKNNTGKYRAGSSDSKSKLDWGILGGLNPTKSMSLKNLYAGLFATYNLNSRWGINAQVRMLSPQSISGSYTHANGSKVDSSKILLITDSRKAYFITVPVYGVYRVSRNVSIKAGPVISVPLKQEAGSTLLAPATIKKDSAYYAATINQLNGTRYNQQINFGIAGGLVVQYGRLSIEAAYLKTLGGYQVNSGFGSYKAKNGSLQLTIGFKLNKPKR